MVRAGPHRGRGHLGGGHPLVELGQPVLDGVDGGDAEHLLGSRVAQQHVHEGHHLQRLAQAHAVRQDAAKATRGVKATHALHHVVKQEADAANLRGRVTVRIYLSLVTRCSYFGDRDAELTCEGIRRFAC